MSTNTVANYPLIYREEPTLRLAIVYNPFDLSNTQVETLVYNQDFTLKDYLEGLPEEVAWIVGYNGEAIDPDRWHEIKPTPFSTLSLVRVPEGGKSGKSILRLVALLAVVIAAPYLAGPLLGTMNIAAVAGSTAMTAATMGITMAGSMLVNAILPPAAPTNNRIQESPTYGYDGPKNTSQENIPFPRGYGEQRVGGNIVDCFTQNYGDTQYLFMRTVLNDGEIESVSDIEVNGQTIDTFTDIQTVVSLGEDPATPNDWFNEAVSQVNRNSKLSTTYVTHQTDSAVDRLRFDLLFPAGLIFANDKGKKTPHNVVLQIQYREIDNAGDPVGAGTWENLPIYAGNFQKLSVEPTYNTASGESVSGFAVPVPGSVTTVDAPPYVFIQDRTETSKRVSIDSMPLGLARYEARVRRTRNEIIGGNHNQVTDCYITDVSEITASPVNLNGVATLSLRVKMTDQLNSIPTVTALCKLSKVDIYDEDGTVIEKAWTDNPSDIVIDVLTNPIQGAGYNPAKIVWPKVVEFRDHCTANNLKFNGTFDTVSTLWDAAQSVAKVGHAALISRGTKFSFTIDTTADPVMVFGPGNILKDTFQKTWLSLNDRANEIQIEFANSADGFKRQVVRRTKASVIASGERIKPTNIDGFGITNAEQAAAEADYHARTNSFLNETIDFDAPLEAIGINIGDVALIQHDSINFTDGCAGRLKAGSTSTVINLDRPATMVADTDYSLLVLHSAVKRSDVTVTSKLGDRLTVTGVAEGDIPRISRLIQGSNDIEVIRVTRVSGTTCYVTLEDADDINTGAASLWDTDVIEERDVVLAVGETSQVTLQSALSQAPDEYANFMFGEKQNVRKPFRLRSIKGSDIDRRTLSWVKYDDRVYEPGDFSDVVVETRPNRPLKHVSFLTATWERAPLPDQQRIPVTLNWAKPTGDYNYGGADIWVQRLSPMIDGVEDPDPEAPTWELLGSAHNVTTFQRDFSRGENLVFRVVSYNDRLTRSPLSSTPTVAADLQVFNITLNAPESLDVTVTWKTQPTINFAWSASTNDALLPEMKRPDRWRIERKAVTAPQYADIAAAEDIDDWPTEVLDDDGWEFVTRTTDLSVSVSTPIFYVSGWAFRVRGERGWAASPWSYDSLNLLAPALPTSITNLRLGLGTAGATSDTFVGPDATWTWDNILDQATGDFADLSLYWLDYRVRILDAEDNVLRTEYTSDPQYSYSYTKNHEDSVSASLRARRTFKIGVSLRGREGQFSSEVIQTVTNPAPATPVGVDGAVNIDGMAITWQANTDIDYAGTNVWVSTTDGFTPGPSNLAFAGSANGCRVPIYSIGTYYIRVGHFDRFDNTPANISAQIEIEAITLVELEIDEALEAIDEAWGRIDELNEGLIIASHDIMEADARFDALTHVDGNSLKADYIHNVEVINGELEASASQIEGLHAQLNTPETGLEARFTDYQTVVVDQLALKASVSDLETLEAEVTTATADLSADFIDYQTVVSDALNLKASASDLSELSSQINTPGTGLEARFTSFQTTVTDALTGVASSTALAELEAQINTPSTGLEARFASYQTTVASALDLKASASDFSGLNSQINAGGTGLEARFSSYQTTVADALTLKADSSSVSSLSSTVGGHTATLTALSSTSATLSGRTSAHWTIETNAGSGATAFIAARAETSPGVVESNVGIGARTFSVYNSSGGVWKKALEVSGGNARFTGNLSAGGRISQGPSSAGTFVALESFSVLAGHTEAIDFSDRDFLVTPIVTVDYASTTALSPLTAGEAYDIKPTSLTSGGFTAYVQIITPGTPTTHTQTSATVSGSAGSYFVAELDKPDASDAIDGNYTVAVSGTVRMNLITASPPDNWQYYGEVSVDVIFWTGSAFMYAGTFSLSAYEDLAYDAGSYVVGAFSGSGVVNYGDPVPSNPSGPDVVIQAGGGYVESFSFGAFSYTGLTSTGTRTPAGKVKFLIQPRNSTL